MHFHLPGWNPVPCATAVAFGGRRGIHPPRKPNPIRGAPAPEEKSSLDPAENHISPQPLKSRLKSRPDTCRTQPRFLSNDILRRATTAAILALLLLGSGRAAGQGTKPAQGIQQADAAFRAGYAAQQAGRLEEARTQFAEVVRLAPQIAEGREALGVVLLEQGKASDAVPQLAEAARLKPKDQAFETNLAYALAQSGQADKALPHFEAAVTLAQGGHGPLEATFHDAYARALAAAGKHAEALKEFAKEEKITGPRADLEDAIGTVNAQMGRWNEAQSAFQRALAIDPDSVRARVHLGVVYRQQNQLAASIDELAGATRMQPPSAEAFAEYGRSLALAGRDEDAEPAFQQALKLNPDLPGAAADLAMTLQRLGRQQEAIPWFKKALDREPHNENVLVNLALAHTMTGSAREALAYLDRAQAENPQDASVYKNRGVAHVQLSAFDEAIQDFKAALALDANDPQLHYDLGLAYKFKDRLEESIAELKRAAEMDPNLEDPPYTLGITYMQMGKLDDAVAQLRKAVALRADNGNAWAILGSTLKQNGKLEEAAEALEKAIPLQAGQPGPLVTLAGVLAEQAADLGAQAEAADASGDTQKASQLRDRMKELRARATEYRRQGAELSRAAVNRQRASFALNAGNQLLLRGQVAEAVSRYQESIAADATFPEPHKQLAIAYERQGRTQEAAGERAKAEQLEKSK